MTCIYTLSTAMRIVVQNSTKRRAPPGTSFQEKPTTMVKKMNDIWLATNTKVGTSSRLKGSEFNSENTVSIGGKNSAQTFHKRLQASTVLARHSGV
jgi:hypothetical protein